MPSFTKKAIMESFLRLSEKKQLDKITVRDIVDDCGINRNTFYYYFQDIYAVLEEYCAIAIAKLPENQSAADVFDAFFHLSQQFTFTHPRAAKMLAFSLGYEGLERYFGTRLNPIFHACILRQTGSAPSLTVLRFLRHALIGLCLDVMRGEKCDADVNEELKRLLNALFP
jgi:AcrR family transcriptional regulator